MPKGKRRSRKRQPRPEEALSARAIDKIRRRDARGVTRYDPSITDQLDRDRRRLLEDIDAQLARLDDAPDTRQNSQMRAYLLERRELLTRRLPT